MYPHPHIITPRPHIITPHPHIIIPLSSLQLLSGLIVTTTLVLETFLSSSPTRTAMAERHNWPTVPVSAIKAAYLATAELWVSSV